MLDAIVKEVPAGLENYYKQEGDHFVLQVKPVDGYALENIEGLKTALSKERTLASEYKKNLSAFEGLEAGKVKTDLEELAKLRELDVDELAKEKIQIAVKDHQEKANALITAKEQELSLAVNQVDQLMRQQAITQAVLTEKGSVELLTPILQGQTKLSKSEQGAFIVEVVDSSGNLRFNNKGEPMALSELVSELKASPAYGRAFDASGTSGSGAGANGGAGSNHKRSEMTAAEKLDYINKHGQEKYLSLPK